MLKRLIAAMLYTGFLLGANPATAIDPAALEALKADTLKKLAVHDAPRALSDAAFFDPGGNERRLSDYRGRVVLLNFWATWCAPCRKEMPGLDRLARDYGEARFAVVPIATGRNPMPAIEKFFADIAVTDLPVLLDPKSALARDIAVMGLPVTILMDHEGREVARLMGDAEWDRPSGRAIIDALLADLPS